MTGETLRVGLYASGETLAAIDRSLVALRAWAAEHREWRVVEEYVDELGAFDREDYQRLLADAEAGRLDLVIFRSLAEFLPGGTGATVRCLVSLGRVGVRFASRTEPNLSTLDDRGGRLVQTLRVLEAQEHHRFSAHLSRRISEGRREGHRAGRKRLPLETRQAIARHRRNGLSIAATAEDLGVARSTVTKYQDSPNGELIEPLPERAIRAIFGRGRG
jgi:DNA invertase Pin-like site-specific DNA recombinase